jgi:hypothetical protein
MRIDYSKYADKVQFWKSVVEKSKDFTGTSPPSIFVGRHSYPKVFVGVLSPPQQHETTEILDSPETWYREKATIGQILGYRGQMVYSRFQTDSVKSKPGKLEEVVQEVSMSKKSADVEINLKSKPVFGFESDLASTPIGSAGQVDRMRLVSNPSVGRRVDYIVSDTDMRAGDALVDLYRRGIPISRIQKIFSAGLLGVPFQRKFVPTRWSVTAVDDTIGKSMMREVRELPEIDEFTLFHNEYLGNHYEVLFIPGQYQYELVEIWNSPMSTSIGSDYEPNRGRKAYASNTEGAFYAGRLAAMEQMSRMRRQGSVLIVREILPSYDVPMGIWQMRETVRGAFEGKPEKFSGLQEALQRVSSRVSIGARWREKSELLKNVKEQRKVSAFFRPSSSSGSA